MIRDSISPIRSLCSGLLIAIFLSCSVSEVKAQVVKGFSQDQVPIQGSIKLREFAALYFEMGDFESALPLYEQLSQRYPDRIKFLFRTGVCFYKKTKLGTYE